MGLLIIKAQNDNIYSSFKQILIKMKDIFVIFAVKIHK